MLPVLLFVCAQACFFFSPALCFLISAQACRLSLSLFSVKRRCADCPGHGVVQRDVQFTRCNWSGSERLYCDSLKPRLNAALCAVAALHLPLAPSMSFVHDAHAMYTGKHARNYQLAR